VHLINLIFYTKLESYNVGLRLLELHKAVEYLYWSVLKIMDAGYCLYVHIFMKNIKSLKTFNFNNSNQLMPDLRIQQSRRDN